MSRPPTPTIDRLLARCTETDAGCWLFEGSLSNAGYGQIRDINQGRLLLAHRVTYAYFRAEIPEGLVIDHLCRVRHCCYPWHLEPVTNRENGRRGENPMAGRWRLDFERAKTHCPWGHPYSEVNTYVTSRGARQCRECSRRRQAEFKARQRVDDLAKLIGDPMPEPARSTA